MPDDDNGFPPGPSPPPSRSAPPTVALGRLIGRAGDTVRGAINRRRRLPDSAETELYNVPRGGWRCSASPVRRRPWILIRKDPGKVLVLRSIEVMCKRRRRRSRSQSVGPRQRNAKHSSWQRKKIFASAFAASSSSICKRSRRSRLKTCAEWKHVKYTVETSSLRTRATSQPILSKKSRVEAILRFTSHLTFNLFFVKTFQTLAEFLW